MAAQARPMGENLEQAAILDSRTTIHHDRQASLFRPLGGAGVNHSELSPQDACAFGDRFLRNRRKIFGTAKDIDDCNWLRNRGKVRITSLAQFVTQSLWL